MDTRVHLRTIILPLLSVISRHTTYHLYVGCVVLLQPSTSWLEREPAQHIKPYPIPTTFQFLTYLPVIQHIVADPQISPNPLLKALASAIQQRWSSNTSPGDSVGTASAAGLSIHNPYTTTIPSCDVHTKRGACLLIANAAGNDSVGLSPTSHG